MADKTKKKTTVKSKKTTKAAAPAKAATARKSRAKALQTITQAERQRLVEQAAYFIAERRGFQGNPHDDWVAAEEEVTANLARKNVLVI
jgi:hypothetical protein